MADDQPDPDEPVEQPETDLNADEHDREVTIAEGRTDNDEEDDEDSPDDDAGDAGKFRAPRPESFERLMLSPHNAAVIGRMILHYPARDVDLWLDGDAALRLLTMYRNRREGDLGDRLDPVNTDANNAFVVLDLDDPPLAMSWLPGVPARRPRTALDPTVEPA